MMNKAVTTLLYANAMLATFMGVSSLTMHNVLIGIAFAFLAKNLNK